MPQGINGAAGGHPTGHIQHVGGVAGGVGGLHLPHRLAHGAAQQVVLAHALAHKEGVLPQKQQAEDGCRAPTQSGGGPGSGKADENVGPEPANAGTRQHQQARTTDHIIEAEEGKCRHHRHRRPSPRPENRPPPAALRRRRQRQRQRRQHQRQQQIVEAKPIPQPAAHGRQRIPHALSEISGILKQRFRIIQAQGRRAGADEEQADQEPNHGGRAPEQAVAHHLPRGLALRPGHKPHQEGNEQAILMRERGQQRARQPHEGPAAPPAEARQAIAEEAGEDKRCHQQVKQRANPGYGLITEWIEPEKEGGQRTAPTEPRTRPARGQHLP